MISIVTYPSGDNLLVKTSQLPGGSVITFDDGALEDLISDSSKTPILTRF